MHSSLLFSIITFWSVWYASALINRVVCICTITARISLLSNCDPQCLFLFDMVWSRTWKTPFQMPSLSQDRGPEPDPCEAWAKDNKCHGSGGIFLPVGTIILIGVGREKNESVFWAGMKDMTRSHDVYALVPNVPGKDWKKGKSCRWWCICIHHTQTLSIHTFTRIQ